MPLILFRSDANVLFILFRLKGGRCQASQTVCVFFYFDFDMGAKNRVDECWWQNFCSSVRSRRRTSVMRCWCFVLMHTNTAKTHEPKNRQEQEQRRVRIHCEFNAFYCGVRRSVVLAFAKRVSAVTAKSSQSVWSRLFPNHSSSYPFSIKLCFFCDVRIIWRLIAHTNHAPCSVFSQTLNGMLRPGLEWIDIWYVTKKWSEKSKFIWVDANLRQHLYHSQKPTSVRPRSVVIFFIFFFRFSLYSNNEQIRRTHDIWIQVHAECVCVSMRLHSLLVLCAATFLSTLYVSFRFFFLSLLGRLESLLLFAHAMNMWKPS